MADIVSKIVFQSSGGDKVAHDVDKIKRSFDNAAKSKSAFESSSGGGGSLPTDAFGRATSKPPLALPSPSGEGSDLLGSSTSHRSLLSDIRNRSNQHASLFRNAVGAFQAGTGDIVQGGGSALNMIGSMGKFGVAGVAALVASAVGI